ncbi:MAG: hypothetical protein ACE5FQ_01365 [Thiogranum sp.]
MQKTINYTGRRKILHSELQIKLVEHGDAVPEFDVDFSLKRENLPDDAAIYIEAYKNNTSQRFDFGTVGQITKPENRILDQIDLTAPTLFRIRLVSMADLLPVLTRSGRKVMMKFRRVVCYQ